MRWIMKIISGLIMCVFAAKAAGGREMIEVPILELIPIVWLYIYGLMLIINCITGGAEATWDELRQKYNDELPEEK